MIRKVIGKIFYKESNKKYSLNDSEINYLKNFTVSKLNILKTDK